MSVFDEYARYYDLLYKDKDYAAETAYVADTLRRFAPQAKRVLEFGSGTGIHGRLLAQKGFDVAGVERSAEMVARASQSAIPAAPGSFTCRQGDIRNAAADGKFDAVISLFHVVSYQTANEDILATLHNAARHLNPGGIFLFDVWYTPAVLTQRPEVRVKRMEDEQTRILRVAEPISRAHENVIEVHYTAFIEDKSSGDIKQIAEVHPMRHFSSPELDILAGQAGFIPLHSEEFRSAKTPGEKTWGVCFIWWRA